MFARFCRQQVAISPAPTSRLQAHGTFSSLPTSALRRHSTAATMGTINNQQAQAQGVSSSWLGYKGAAGFDLRSTSVHRDRRRSK